MPGMDRALSFGSDALAYDRHRPGYPDAVADLALAHAHGPVRRALEIGAGTGKATRVFAARGIEVVAVEPDPAMRTVLEQHVRDHGWPVEVVDATFETVDLDAVGPVDLLFAAAAFHWTDPATRWERIACVVRPGGAVALFGAARDLADDGLREEVDAIMADVMGEDPVGRWSADELRQQPTFTDVVETEIPHRATMSADDYITFLTTISACRVLTPTQRDELLGSVRAVLPDLVEVTEDNALHLARRTDDHPRSTP